jgi:hypothetical protein
VQRRDPWLTFTAYGGRQPGLQQLREQLPVPDASGGRLPAATANAVAAT